MTALPLAAVLGLAAAFAGSIGWQLMQPDELPAQAGPVATERAVAVAEPDRRGLVAVALARPLFSPERRPPGPAAVAAPAPEKAVPRLTGVLVTAEGRAAVFAGSPQPLVLREGERIGGFTVQAIEPGLVTLRGPEGVRALQPSFDPSPASGAPAGGGVARPGLPLLPGPALDGARGSVPFASNPAPSGADLIRQFPPRAADDAAAPAR